MVFDVSTDCFDFISFKMFKSISYCWICSIDALRYRDSVLAVLRHSLIIPIELHRLQKLAMHTHKFWLCSFAHTWNADVKYSRMVRYGSLCFAATFDVFFFWLYFSVIVVVVISVSSRMFVFLLLQLSFKSKIDRKKNPCTCVLKCQWNGCVYSSKIVSLYGFSFDTEQLHAKWCQHYRHVNKRYRLVNHFSKYLYACVCVCLFVCVSVCCEYDTIFKYVVSLRSVLLFCCCLLIFFSRCEIDSVAAYCAHFS